MWTCWSSWPNRRDYRAGEARRVIEERRFKAAVDADWALSARAGVTGVPTFIAGGHQMVGAQPDEVLRQLMRAAGAVSRERP